MNANIRIAMLVAIMSMIVPKQMVAQNAKDVLNNVISTYEKSKGITADYVITYDKTTDRGTIDMEGDKFRILSNDLKCWYDGKTQWAYSTLTDEVNVTEPTEEELRMSNPYVALSSFKGKSQMAVVSMSTGEQMLSLIPDDKGDVKMIQLFVNKSNYRITKAVFSMADNSMYTVIVENYETGKKFQSGTFRYEAKYVPAGTQVVDLR